MERGEKECEREEEEKGEEDVGGAGGGVWSSEWVEESLQEWRWEGRRMVGERSKGRREEGEDGKMLVMVILIGVAAVTVIRDVLVLRIHYKLYKISNLKLCM